MAYVFHSSRQRTDGTCADKDKWILSQAQAIKVITGVTPTCWRPPYGDIDVSMVFPTCPDIRHTKLFICDRTGFVLLRMR